MKKIVVAFAKTAISHYFSEKDYKEAARREKHVADAIRRLSKSRIEFKFVGYGAGSSEKFSTKEIHKGCKDLDIELNIMEKPIAQIEVTGSPQWNFERSRFFPIVTHKIERARKHELPIYFVFVLDVEPSPNEWWRKAEGCDQYPRRILNTRYGPVDNYLTDKNSWHRGLKSLVEELLKIT